MTNNKLHKTNNSKAPNIKSKMFNLLSIVILVLFGIWCLGFGICLPVSAATTTITTSPTGATNLQSNIGGASIGYIRVGSAEVATLAWRPDFKYGPWGLGADINLSLGSQAKPANYENLVIRYVEYDDYKKGLRYGVLDNVTYGNGLILNNYTTRKGSNMMLNNEQTGLRGYIDLDALVLKAMGTRSNIYAARVEDRLNPNLTLSGYYVTDTTGRSIVQPGGTTKVFPSVSAVGIDAIAPLPANFTAFAEGGSLINHGNGLAAGIGWAYDLMVANANFAAEYRMLDKGFVPGYFGVDYENNPVDLASAEATGQAKNGYLVKLGINALGLATFRGVFESYINSNSALNADLTAKLGDQIGFVGYYRQPNFVDFSSVTLQQGAILGADVTYKVNQLTSLIVHYKQAYNPTTGQVETTQYYEIGLNF